MLNATIFITGGTGLIGRWATAKLTAQGKKVAILARNAALRDSSYRQWISDHGGNPDNLILINGDLAKEDLDLGADDKALLQSVTHVFHMGASFDWGLSETFAKKVNVYGTNTLLKLANSLPKLERFVLVSGYMVAAAERWAPFGLIKPDDISPMPVEPKQLKRMYKELGAYEASKLEADLLTRDFCHTHKMPLTILNPATVIGSAETGELDQDQGLSAIAQAIWRNLFSAVPGKKQDWIPLTTIDYVSDFLTKAPFLPETKNQEYTLLDEATPRFSELAAMIARHLGRKAPSKHMPKGLMKFLLNAGLSKLTGTSGESLSFLGSYYFDTGPANKIAQKIGLEKGDILEAIRRTTDQFSANHFGKTKSPFKAGTFRYQEIAGSRTLVGGNSKTATHVFLHGLPLNADSWHPTIEHLNGEALFADLPTLGRSTSRIDVDPVDWVTSLCNDLTDAPFIVGHSLGSGIAVDYAHKYPDRVSGLILIAPYFLQLKPKASLKLSFSHADMKQLLANGADTTPQLVDSAYHSLKNPGGLLRIGKQLSKAQKPDRREALLAKLQSLQMPVLLISGEHDPLAVSIAGPEVVEITGASHFPQITHSDQVAALINGFADGTQTNPALRRA